MKKVLHVLVAAMMGVALILSPMATPVYAESDDDMEPCTCANGESGTRPKTSILGHDNNSHTGCECGSGEGAISILRLVVNVMTIGVGILGVLGITLVGMQYLTAGGDVGKTKKAKQRMAEIIIGLIIYVLIYSLLGWLLPGFDTFRI